MEIKFFLELMFERFLKRVLLGRGVVKLKVDWGVVIVDFVVVVDLRFLSMLRDSLGVMVVWVVLVLMVRLWGL